MGREQSQAGLAKLAEWASAYWTRRDDRSFAGHTRLFHAFGGTRVHLRSEVDVDRFVGLLGDANHGA